MNNDTNLIVGKINAGKTRGVLLNKVKNMIDNNENILVFDQKCEYYGTFYNKLKEKKYTTLVINLDDPKKSNGYNPLLLPYHYYKNGDKDKAIELLNGIAHEICKEESTSDPFWENMASSYFVALTLILFKEGKEDEINLGSVQIMISQSENKKDGTTLLKKYLENVNILDTIYILASGIVFAPAETKGSILSVLKSKLNVYCCKQNLLNMLCSNEFDLNKITDKTAIFIMGSAKTNVIANILINQLIMVSKDKKIPYNLVLDNFNALPKLSDFKVMVENATHYNLKLYVAIIDLNEMEDMYGKYVFDKFQNIIKVEGDLELKQVCDNATYPELHGNHEYFNLEEFMKNNN